MLMTVICDKNTLKLDKCMSVTSLKGQLKGSFLDDTYKCFNSL